MDDVNTDVIEATPSLDASPEVGNAPVADIGESVPQTAEQATAEQSTKEAEAPSQLPENDDDLKGQENNPHVQAIAQLRQELRARNQVVDSYKPLDSWKPLAETISDPALAQSSYELVTAIHTPAADNPSGFTSRPFLERMESESPGTIDQIFSDVCSFQITDDKGRPTTVVRELYRSHGLDPDRIDDYRNIDSLRASGIVTADDLGKVPEKYHDAFKSLSSAARDDIVAMKETNPAAMEEYLRNAQDALEARTWRQKDETAKAEAAKAEEAKFESELSVAVEQDILTEVKAISDSIHQNLSSQWKPSTDEATNNLEYAKVLSVLATLQNPAYRFVAENALKQVGGSLDGFDALANQWSERRSAYTVYNAKGDKWQAQRALSDASAARQRMSIKLNDYALKLAQVSGNRLQAQAQQTATQLAAASARFVPAGNGQAPQGPTNPYAQNPHTVGSQEYFAFNRKLDREYSLTNASMFGG